MGIWSLGLPKRTSAERASKWGGIACLLQSARLTIGNIVSVSVTEKSLDNAIVWLIGASLIPFFLLVAGVRLWRSKDIGLGGLAALVVAADLVLLGPTPTSPVTIIALAIKVVLLGFILNGVRGALAQLKVDYESDVHKVFQ